jgi:hypothetical protein
VGASFAFSQARWMAPAGAVVNHLGSWAKVPSATQAVFRPSSVREAYARAYWKPGFFAQLGPTERGMVTG